MPLISVIVPVYEAEEYLHRCIDSILRQTFTDFDLILIDDGSHDNSGLICDEYAKYDKRVHVIHQENQGVAAARNAGLDWSFNNSPSEWICFVDSDDWVKLDYLSKLLNAAEEKSVSVCVCEYICSNGEEEAVANQIYEINVISPEKYYVLNNTNFIVPWGKLYKKKCFQFIRYPVGKIHEDEWITHKVLFEFDYVAVIREPLYLYFANPKGITKSRWNVKRLDSIEALEKQMLYMKQHGYEQAYEYAIKKYAVDLSSQIWIIKKSDRVIQKNILLKLRLKLKRLLLTNHNIVPFKENAWIYECAFPKLIQIYWIAKAQVGKITKQCKVL